MNVGGVQLEFVERGGVMVVAVVVVVVVGLRAAAISVHVEIVVGQQFCGIEDHIVDVRCGPVHADKVHGPVVLHTDRIAAGAALEARRRRGGRELRVVIHVLRRHRVHQIQRFRAVFGLNGGVLQLLLLPGVIADADADAVATILHLVALLVAVAVNMVMHRGGRVVIVVGGQVVLPTAVAALHGALVYGAAAQVQHGRRRTLVVTRMNGCGHVLCGRPLIHPMQLERVAAVGGRGRGRLHRLTVDGRRRLRAGREPEVGSGHNNIIVIIILDDRRRR